MESDIIKNGIFVCTEIDNLFGRLWHNYITGMMSEEDYVKAYIEILQYGLKKLEER